MNPQKIILKKFNDRRGYLLELLPKKFRKKFIYFILTYSKKIVVRGLHYDLGLKEEKLVYVLNLKKGIEYKKKFCKILKEGEALYIPKGFAHGYKCIGKKIF